MLWTLTGLVLCIGATAAVLACWLWVHLFSCLWAYRPRYGANRARAASRAARRRRDENLEEGDCEMSSFSQKPEQREDGPGGATGRSDEKKVGCLLLYENGTTQFP
jgi:hypothetical protein